MSDDIIEHIRNRVAQCRRLAALINHPEARATLLQMAQEGEADIRKLEEQAGQPNPMAPPIQN